jgi:hypothetical protein
MPIFVTQYLRAHKVAQNERRLRSVAWAEADYVFDRGGGVPMLLLSVSQRFSKCADARMRREVKSSGQGGRGSREAGAGEQVAATIDHSRMRGLGPQIMSSSEAASD